MTRRDSNPAGHGRSRTAAARALGLAGLLAAAAAATPAPAAAAAGAAPPDRLEELARLRERVEAARDAGDELRRELRDLREIHRSERIGDRRAAAIRAMVSEAAADAGSRSSLLGGGFSAGWDGGFYLEDPEGRFRLDIGAHAQFRFLVNKQQRVFNDRTRVGFEQTRTRLMLRGHVFTPDLQYFVQVDPTRNERIADRQDPAANLPTGLFYLEEAWVRYRIAPRWFVRFGQFKLPFNREELVDPSRQLAVERSLVNESLNLGRSQGIELQWRGETERFDLAIHDGATDDIGGTLRVGLVDPEPRVNSNALNPDAEWAVAARFESLLAGSWRQFDDFTSPPGDDFGLLVGLAGHAYKTESTGAATGTPGNERDENRWYGATADVSVELGGGSLFGSVIYQYLDTRPQFEIYSVVLQGAAYIHREHELFLRWEWGQIDNVAQADLNVFVGGWNWYVDGHDLKLTVDFGFAESIIDLIWTSTVAGFRRDFRGDEHQWVIRSQFQLGF